MLRFSLTFIPMTSSEIKDEQGRDRPAESGAKVRSSVVSVLILRHVRV